MNTYFLPLEDCYWISTHPVFLGISPIKSFEKLTAIFIVTRKISHETFHKKYIYDITDKY